MLKRVALFCSQARGRVALRVLCTLALTLAVGMVATSAFATDPVITSAVDFSGIVPVLITAAGVILTLIVTGVMGLFLGILGVKIVIKLINKVT